MSAVHNLEVSEHRHSFRQSEQVDGQIVLPNWSTLDCRVVNMSERGAHLIMQGALFVPDKFTLNIECLELTEPVTVTWRQATSLGVRFEKIWDAQNDGFEFWR